MALGSASRRGRVDADAASVRWHLNRGRLYVSKLSMHFLMMWFKLFFCEHHNNDYNSHFIFLERGFQLKTQKEFERQNRSAYVY